MHAADEDGRPRCSWETGDLLRAYHDEEWGVPVHDDRRQFEFLTLEGAQAGLSWLTVLKRRDGYRRAFAGFDPAVVAAFDVARLDTLVQDPGIIRHRAKIESTVTNARAVLAVAEEFGTFDAYVWGFVGDEVIQNHRRQGQALPGFTPLSKQLSADLRRRGFRFVGPTVIYAHLQAAGLVQDHVTSCFRSSELGG
jgi:DNA-3-methyladenine glycosylase I